MWKVRKAKLTEATGAAVQHQREKGDISQMTKWEGD